MAVPVGLKGSMRRSEDDLYGVKSLKKKRIWGQEVAAEPGLGVRRWGSNPGGVRVFHDVLQVTPSPSVKLEGLTWRSIMGAFLLVIFYRGATNKEMQAEQLWKRRNKRVWRPPALSNHTAPLRYLCRPLGFQARRCSLKHWFSSWAPRWDRWGDLKTANARVLLPRLWFCCSRWSIDTRIF